VVRQNHKHIRNGLVIRMANGARVERGHRAQVPGLNGPLTSCSFRLAPALVPGARGGVTRPSSAPPGRASR
jgi:hypothetical protein